MFTASKAEKTFNEMSTIAKTCSCMSRLVEAGRKRKRLPQQRSLSYMNSLKAAVTKHQRKSGGSRMTDLINCATRVN
jgi:hypothetical protein